MSDFLPPSGRIQCTRCFTDVTEFGKSIRNGGDWRITANPLAWGSPDPEILVLGFSKGPTQLSALDRQPHNEVPYAGGRAAIGKIFAHVGLLEQGSNEHYNREVSKLIADQEGRFHFGSLIRCTVERQRQGKWSGTGGGMLDRFLLDPFGNEVARNCSSRFLATLSPRTRLVLMFGLGTNKNYISASRRLIEEARPGCWQTVNEVTYTDGSLTVVHTEHFKSQGRLLPDWLDPNSKRGALGLAARDGVRYALSA